MTTWTAKVGLRKPTWDDVECDCDDCQTSDWFLAAVHTPQPTREAGWLRDQVRRAAATLDGLPPEMVETMAHRTAVRAAQARVASIPASHRRYLENEFQRAEADARAILRAKGRAQ